MNSQQLCFSTTKQVESKLLDGWFNGNKTIYNPPRSKSYPLNNFYFKRI